VQHVFYYAITRTGTDERYVGSSIKLRSRWKTHRCDLKYGRHHCAALQEAWDKYGAKAFAFSVLAEADCADVNERAAHELQWIIKLGTYNAMTHYVDTHNLRPVSVADRELRRAVALNRIALDPELAAFLKKRGEAIGSYMQSPEGREMMSRVMRERWKDAKLAAVHLKGLTNRWNQPGEREKMSATMKAVRGTKEARQKHSKTLSKTWADPEASANFRAARAAQWNDPERRRIQSEKLKAAWATRKAAAQS
jgi:hypothetical protein